MRSSGERHDPGQAKRLFNALGAAVDKLIKEEGASQAVIAQGCGEFLAMVLAELSVEHGDTEEQLAGRIAIYTQALDESIRHNVQTLQRARSQ